MPLTIIRGDISKVNTDAVVIPANQFLVEGPGASHAIFEGAGRQKLKEACAKLGRCEIGNSVITDGFNLPAKHIIHTVNPAYIDGEHRENELLYQAYTSALELAEENRLESIAFPLLSAGNYGYPKGEALRIANEAIGDFLEKPSVDNEMDIKLVLHDGLSLELPEIAISEIEYSLLLLRTEKKRRDALPVLESSVNCDMDYSFIPDPPEGKSFQDVLLKYLNNSGMSNPEIYKRANLTRKTFSKILSDHHIPKRNTVIALVIALKLSTKQAEELLASAGYAFMEADLGDIIVQHFIKRRQYDIFLINEMLFDYDQPLLGSVAS